MDNLCEKCEEVEIEVTCSCGAKFCERCFSRKHLARNPTHRKGGSRKDEDAWNWFTGKFAGVRGLSDQFKDDEAAKWFGLYTDTRPGKEKGYLVDTPRLRNLMSESLTWYPDSPRRQFPSIASFVGETGAGKSTLVRSMIYNSEKSKEFNPLEAPVPGAGAESSTKSTTGEVNLYLDPATFGRESPVFYVDCEGLMGSSAPLSASHQTSWTKDAMSKQYWISQNIDRRTAVQTLYPRFLYIFSDVICYVTGNQRTWAESAVRLLEWSLVGAESSLNHGALPALIIVLNGPRLDRQDWINGHPKAATEAFFDAIAGEIGKNEFINGLVKKYNCQRMDELFSRSYSSVHVHYIPIKGYGICGTTETVVAQAVKLSHQIRSDAKRVQSARAKNWMRFDTKQLSVLVTSAFKHLVTGKNDPFDFSKCREQLPIPKSAEGHFSEILGHCLRGDMEEKFEQVANAIASSLLRHAIHDEKSDSGAPLTPATVFNKEIRSLCDSAVSQFLDENVRCAFVNPSDGQKCVNTRIGHAQGHQDSTGACLQTGPFVSGNFDAQSFLAAVEKSIGRLMTTIDSTAPAGWLGWRRRAAEVHLDNLMELRKSDGFPWMEPGGYMRNDFGRNSSVCYGCFFGESEYRLPCGHAICRSCLEDFDQTPENAQYPGSFTHEFCVVCDATGVRWPYKMHVKPRLAGVRVLSLDGGGVRGVVELVVLRELEKQIGLGIPLGRFFDFIIGTSAGGIISLGLGVQDRTVDDCLSRFHKFTRTSFKRKLLTKTKLIRPLGRMIRSSIYQTRELEDAIRQAFSPASNQELFGLRRPCRVAVTTTVSKELKLIANYNRGNVDKYLDSDDAIWRAARCTSAAPMFFERAYYAFEECWDGGLKANNPIQLAVTEPQSIWGQDVEFDLVLSVGSGCASGSVKQPAHRKQGWVSELLKTMLSSMDGENAWESFRPEPRIRDKAVRLNVKLKGPKQPSLDDVDAVLPMQSAAENHVFQNNTRDGFCASNLSPLSGDLSTQLELIPCLAARLRASMFFFEMHAVYKGNGVADFEGHICCRLAPDEEGFVALMDCTQGFYITVGGRRHELKEIDKTAALRSGAPFKFAISFDCEFDSSYLDSKRPVRINVQFGGKGEHPSGYEVAISGFPLTVNSLLKHADMYSGSYVDVTSSRSAVIQPPVELEDTSVIPKNSETSSVDSEASSVDDEGVVWTDAYDAKSCFSVGVEDFGWMEG